MKESIEQDVLDFVSVHKGTAGPFAIEAMERDLRALLTRSASRSACEAMIAAFPAGAVETLRKWYAEKQRAEQAEAKLAALQEDVKVGDQISGSFFEALKPLKLEAVDVQNPGRHVTDLLDRLAACEARWACAKSHDSELDTDDLPLDAIRRRIEADYQDIPQPDTGIRQQDAITLLDRLAAVEKHIGAHHVMPCATCDVKTATIADLQAKLAVERAAWMIERTGSSQENGGMTVFIAIGADGSMFWTTGGNEYCLRFSRKGDAERALLLLCKDAPTTCRVEEHMWIEQALTDAQGKPKETP